MTYDLVIRNGTIVDGSGEEPYVGDVAISAGVLAAVGAVDGAGREEIDAKGMLVTPGFVDVHTHYDGQVTWEQRLSPSSNHGVTTVVMGNCGVGFAPVRPEHKALMIRLMEGVEDIPEVVMAEGVPFNWESFPDYLDALAERRTDVDFAAQLPHSPLRVYVMGERAAAGEPATGADLAEMRRLVAEAVRAGAIGVSTSRVNAHRFRDGTLAPSVGAPEEELNALALGLRDAGAGVFQVAPDVYDETRRECALLRRVAETARRPMSFTITAGVREDWADSLDCLSEANRDGVEMRGQIIPRPFGFLFGLDLSYHPFSLNPSYRAIAGLPLAEKVARMRDPAFRAQLLGEQADDTNPYVLWLVTQSHMLFPLGASLNYTPRIEDSLAARAASLGVDERELIYDELLKDEGHAVLLSPKGNIVDGDMGAGQRVLRHDHVVIGLADGGAHYGVICDASLPTWFLIACVRDAPPEDRYTLAEAVRKLARDTAEAVGLNDRGLLRPGYKADVNIIDFDKLAMAPPQVRLDLPAGGRRLWQGSTGYAATIVSGEVTYRDGQPTGALPGRLVRGERQPHTLDSAA